MPLYGRLRVEDNVDPRVSVCGFSDYTDAVAADLVPWTPLKTSQSSLLSSTMCNVILY